MFAVTFARRIGGTRLPPLLRSFATAPPPGLSDGERTIYTKLAEKFKPSELQVQDVSGLIQRILGVEHRSTHDISTTLLFPGGCGTFYQIIIASGEFKGVPTVKQHRMVNETLKEEIEGIHGLQLKTSVA